MNVDNRSFNFNAKLDQIDHIDNCLFEKKNIWFRSEKNTCASFLFFRCGAKYLPVIQIYVSLISIEKDI